MSGVNLGRRNVLKAALVVGGVAGLGAGGLARLKADPRGPGEFRFRGDAMGTRYNVAFLAPLAETGLREAARSAVDDAIASVDRRMSTFRQDSELSALNRHGERGALALSQETFEVLDTAQRVSRASAGAFDVTAGPLVNAWGFGPKQDRRIPARDELAALRQRVGFGLLELDPRARTVRKAHGGMYVDLSGIAKGYGVDRAAAALEALGIGDYVVELGGEVRARGRNVAGEAWRVGIEEPQDGPRRPRRIVGLPDMALATSGDYRIYFDRAGRRYCHEIDPASGEPVHHTLTSVTVAAAGCANADAMATALMVLGPREGFELAQRSGLAAYFIERTAAGTLLDRQTSAFDRLSPAPPA